MRLILILMIIKNNLFFFFDENLSIICTIYKYKIYNILLLIRFSKYSNFFVPVFFPFFFTKLSIKNKAYHICNKMPQTWNLTSFYNLFFLNSSTKKDVLRAISVKRKNSLFKKYNTYRKSLFWKLRFFVKQKKQQQNKYSNIRNFLKYDVINKKNNFLNLKYNILRKIKKKSRPTAILNTNYKYFKKIFKITRSYKYRNFFKKKLHIYRMNKRFNKRYYANRLIFREVFLKPKNRQFAITKFIEKFKKCGNYNIYKQTQKHLFLILISSQFFFFKSDCFFFLKKYGVFINGKCCTNPYIVLKIGDVVQLPIINTFYNYYKIFRSSMFFFYKKFNSKFFRYIRSKKKRYRTKSIYMPRWVSRLAYISNDVPSFLEVDYTILTIIVIYDCNSYTDIHKNIKHNVLLHLYRTYNWRTLA